MAWQPGPVGNGVGGVTGGDASGVQAYTLQGKHSISDLEEAGTENHYKV